MPGYPGRTGQKEEDAQEDRVYPLEKIAKPAKVIY
jgi:hypothetical protein